MYQILIMFSRLCVAIIFCTPNSVFEIIVTDSYHVAYPYTDIDENLGVELFGACEFIKIKFCCSLSLCTNNLYDLVFVFRIDLRVLIIVEP